MISTSAPEHSQENQYVILIWPDSPRSYLSALSDEDEGGAPLPRTTDSAMAVTFATEEEALQARDEAVNLYPGHSFRIDRVK